MFPIFTDQPSIVNQFVEKAPHLEEIGLAEIDAKSVEEIDISALKLKKCSLEGTAFTKNILKNLDDVPTLSINAKDKKISELMPTLGNLSGLRGLDMTIDDSFKTPEIDMSHLEQVKISSSFSLYSIENLFSDPANLKSLHINCSKIETDHHLKKEPPNFSNLQSAYLEYFDLASGDLRFFLKNSPNISKLNPRTLGFLLFL